MALIDTTELMEQFDGDFDLLRMTFELFGEQQEPLKSKLRDALDSGDTTVMHSAAHEIRGMLSNFLAYDACETAGKIEQLENAEHEEAKSLVEQLCDQVSMVGSEIEQFLATQKT